MGRRRTYLRLADVETVTVKNSVRTYVNKVIKTEDIPASCGRGNCMKTYPEHEVTENGAPDKLEVMSSKTNSRCKIRLLKHHRN